MKKLGAVILVMWSLLLGTVMFRAAWAEEVWTDAKYFSFDKQTGTITDYSSKGPKDVVIPAEIDGVPVTTIGEGAFSDNQLTSVEIPDNEVS